MAPIDIEDALSKLDLNEKVELLSGTYNNMTSFLFQPLPPPFYSTT